MKRRDEVLLLPSAQNDGVLKERLLAGDETAFRTCYDKFAPRLMRILTRILHNQARAEEILQETFIAAFRNIHQFRGEVGISAWLVRIATNRAYNAIRDEARHNKAQPMTNHEAGPTIELDVENRDMGRKLMALLDLMGPAKKLALLLRAEGYSVAEIAEVCQEPRGTVLARLSRARAELSVRMVAAGLVESAAV